MAASDILFRVTGDTTGFKSAMSNASASLGAFETKARRVSESMRSLGTSMTVGITLPVIGFATAAVKAAADIDSLRRALLSTTGSAEEAERQFTKLKEVAKLPGIGLEEAVRGSIRLQNYGVSAALAEKALRGVSNAVAGAGGSAEDTGEALRQIGQIWGRQKVTMDNLRIVLERVPQSAKIIREEFGSEALADPAKALEKLGVNSEKFLTVLINRLADAPKVTVGIKTSLENLSQEVKIAAARIGETLVPALIELIPKLEKVAAGVAGMVVGFTKLPPEIQNTAIAIGALVIAAGPALALMARITTAIQAIGVFAGAAGLGLGLLFGATVIAGIAQTMTAIDNLKASTKDYYDELKRRQSGQQDIIAGQGGAGIGGVRERGSFIVPDIGTTADRFKIDLQGISDELGLFGGKAKEVAVPVKKLGDTVAAVPKLIVVDSVAETQFAKLNRLWSDGKVSLAEYEREFAKLSVQLQNGTFVGDQPSKTSLVYVETLERVTAAVGKAKDIMYAWSIQGTEQGKKLEEWRAPLGHLTFDFGLLGTAIQTALHGMDLLRNLRPMQIEISKAGRDAQSRVGITGANNAAATLGFETDQQRYQRIENLRKANDEIRKMHQLGTATGTDVARAQEKLKEAIKGTTKQTKEQSRAMRQVSTIATDLSRSIASAGIGLLFNRRAQADVSRYKEEISDLEAEHRKLIFSQTKGNDVTALLTANQNKLADANRRMGEELRKASAGFAAMEAGRQIISSLAQSITRVLIEGALTKLAKKLIDVGGLLWTVFSGGTGVIKSTVPGVVAEGLGGAIGAGARIAGEAAGAADSASSGIGAALGAANPIVAMVTAVSSVVTAISSVVSNFQFAAMNKSLDLIEKATRYTQIYTGEQSQSILWSTQTTAERMLYANTALDNIGRFASEMLGNLQQINQKGAMAGGGGTVVNMAGAYLLSDSMLDDFIERIARKLKQQGL